MLSKGKSPSQACVAKSRRCGEGLDTKLIIALVMFQLLSQVSASTTQAFVDCAYTGTSQLNSYSQPYPDISSALEALSTLNSTSTYTLNDLNSEIIIKNGSVSNYSFANYSGSFSSAISGSSLTIRYEVETIPYDIPSCSSQLPSIVIDAYTALTLQADTLVFQNIAFAFVAGGFMAFWQEPSLLMKAAATNNLTLINICILESGSSSYYAPVAAFQSHSSLSITGAIFQRYIGQGYNFDSPIQIYNDLLIITQVFELVIYV